MTLTANFFNVTYKGKSTYTQSMRGSKWCNYFKNELHLDGFDYVERKYNEADESFISEGLISFSEFITKFFKSENIVIYILKSARCFLDKNFKRQSYPDPYIKWLKSKEIYWEKYSYFLASFLPGCKIMYGIDNLLAYEKNMVRDHPAAEHYTPENYINQGLEFLKVIGVNLEDYLQPEEIISPFTSLYLSLINK